jgi:hypothetical protein
VRGPELRHQHIHFRLCLCDSHSGLQTAHQSQRVALVAQDIHHARDINIHLQPRRKHGPEIERGREHAYHRHRMIVEQDRAPHNGSIPGKLALPEEISQQHRGRPTLSALLGSEQPSQLRLDPQHGKEIRSYRYGGKLLWLAVARQFVIGIAEERIVGGHILKGTIVALELLIGRHGVGHGGKAAHSALTSHPDELLRIAKRQRAQQDGIDHAEDRDIRADSQG